MSQENVEIVRRASEEFIANDHQTVVADFVGDMSTFRNWPDQDLQSERQRHLHGDQRAYPA